MQQFEESSIKRMLTLKGFIGKLHLATLLSFCGSSSQLHKKLRSILRWPNNPNLHWLCGKLGWVTHFKIDLNVVKSAAGHILVKDSMSRRWDSVGTQQVLVLRINPLLAHLDRGQKKWPTWYLLGANRTRRHPSGPSYRPYCRQNHILSKILHNRNEIPQYNFW